MNGRGALSMLLALLPSCVLAALDVGAQAPAFTAPAMLAGRPFDFSLAASLARGPVVLYFFPAAFTSGCSAEAHEFAQAMPQFRALGATVVGMSTDDIETLGRFSTQACQSAFPVASDATRSVIKAYDAALSQRPDRADRISYVIGPDGKVLYRYASPNFDRHVENTLAALRAADALHPRKPQ